jgi:hypothetical protein
MCGNGPRTGGGQQSIESKSLLLKRAIFPIEHRAQLSAGGGQTTPGPVRDSKEMTPMAFQWTRLPPLRTSQ